MKTALTARNSAIQKYFRDVLGVSLTLRPWIKSTELPFLLRQSYDFLETEMDNVSMLMAIDKADEPPSPVTILKHIREIERRSQREVVYVRDQLASFQRKRLIEKKIPFVVPGNQMYLPALAIDLREHFRQLRQASPKFSPATQVAVLQLLMRPSRELLTPQKLAQQLGYTKMTMSRSFNELESSGLVQIEHRGRERCLTVPENRRLLWTNAQTFLQTPVKATHHVMRFDMALEQHEMSGTIAGLSALAHYTMLAAPSVPVVAMTTNQWKQLTKTRKPSPVSATDSDAISVEVWTYDPEFFAMDRIVDRLSLYLSLKDAGDERVEMAVDELMEKMPW